MGGIMPVVHAMLAQVSAGRVSVLDDQSSGIDDLPDGSCKSLVRLIGLRKYVGITLLSSSWACGRGDLSSILPSIQIRWKLASR
jgi:hypothetical protein